MLCLASRLKPSRSTFAGPSGLSSPLASGMKMKFGADVSDAAEADFDAGEVAAVVEEDGPFVMLAVVVGVFEDRDTVAAGAVGFPGGIREIFDDPDAAAIEIEGDGLRDGRLAGEEGGS